MNIGFKKIYLIVAFLTIVGVFIVGFISVEAAGPVICIADNGYPSVGEIVTFRAEEGEAPYSWEFDDGSSSSPAGSGWSISRSFNVEGVYSMIVHSNDGSQDACPILVQADPGTTPPASTTSPGSASSTPAPFNLENPLGINNVGEFIDKLTSALLQLAIPLVVIIIIIAGVILLTSQGEPDKVTKAKKILLYGLLGFAVILIGRGFVTIIQSILEMRHN